MPLRDALLKPVIVLLLLAATLVVPATAQDREDPGTFVVTREANLYARPSADAPIVHTLRQGTVLSVVHVTDQWYEVRSTTGKPNGFIRRSYAEPFRGRARRQFREGTFRLLDPAVVRETPDMDSRAIATLSAGATVRVVGREGNWYRIESERGDRPPGYIPTMSVERLD